MCMGLKQKAFVEAWYEYGNCMAYAEKDIEIHYTNVYVCECADKITTDSIYSSVFAKSY